MTRESTSIAYRRYINYDICIGCYTCEEVCAFIHGERPYIKLYDADSGLRRPITCFHCVRAPCVYACPTNAMHRDRDGVVKIDVSRCIGCGACVAACPFGIPEIVPSGYAVKCDLCGGLRRMGLEPACVAVCPTRAIVWGPSEYVTTTLRTRALRRLVLTKTIPR